MFRNTVVFLVGVQHMVNIMFFTAAFLMIMTLLYKSITD